MRPILTFSRGLASSAAAGERPRFARIGVAGAGLMGSGIAQVCAQSGYAVTLVDFNARALEKGIAMIETNVGRVIQKQMKEGTIKSAAEGKEKADAILKRIDVKTKELEPLKECDLVVEAIIEDLEIKKKFFTDLSKLAKPNAVLASNTSSFPIVAMATAPGVKSDRFVGLHFFNPVPVMKLVEVVSTPHTDPQVVSDARLFATTLGKTPVSTKDAPGFIVNRLLVPYLAEAMAMVDRKTASIGDIDLAMKLGASHPMGPLTLADYIGLDTCRNILKGWVANYPNQGFFVPKCLDELVNAGHLGVKSGKGFYDYPPPGSNKKQ